MGEGLGAFLCSFLRHGPNLMLYPGAFESRPRHVRKPSAFRLPYEELAVTASDGVKLHAYLIARPAQHELQNNEHMQKLALNFSDYDIRPTVLMFHGNCDNIGRTLPLAQALYERCRCNVLMLSPRGYGLSEGKPSTQGFQRDADAALNYINSRSLLSRSPIILFGQSMGGAFAIDLAGRHPDKITALIVENTFLSIRRLIPDLFPCLSFAAPFFGQWNSAARLARLPRSVALLMLSGQRDVVVPPAHMRELWRTAMEGLGDNLSPSSTYPRSNSKRNLRGRWKPKWYRKNANAPDDRRIRTTENLEKFGFMFGRGSGPERDGRFVELPYGSHNDTWDDTAYWDAVEMFIDGLPMDSLASAKSVDSGISGTGPGR